MCRHDIPTLLGVVTTLCLASIPILCSYTLFNTWCILQYQRAFHNGFASHPAGALPNFTLVRRCESIRSVHPFDGYALPFTLRISGVVFCIRRLCFSLHLLFWADHFALCRVASYSACSWDTIQCYEGNQKSLFHTLGTIVNWALED